MQIKRRRTTKKIEKKKFNRTNERIRAPFVCLIDEKGQNLGEMKTNEALAMTKELGLDLVEINPKAQPPICKMIDYGKMKYEKEKQEHKQKIASKKAEIKGIRLSFKIKGHDLETRVNQAKKFISQGNQVKIEIILRGREKAYANNAREIIKEFMDKTGTPDEIKIMQAPTKQGNKIFGIIAPIAIK